MTQISFHLAQANIALSRAPLSDPLMADFVAQLAHINAVADASPGFVWRLQTDDDAAVINAFKNPLIILNMSVWESVESLYNYAYRSNHVEPLKKRRNWFTKLDQPHLVLWWLPINARPDEMEAHRRLSILEEKGPTPEAFTFGKLYDPQGVAISSRVKEWEQT